MIIHNAMTFTRIAAFTLGAAAVFPTSALTIEVTPGSLAASLETLRSTTDENCYLTGTADKADLSLLRHLSPEVYQLDLRGLKVPDNAIPDYMLFDTRVRRVVLPEGVEKIGKHAFAGSGIRSLTIPASVISIGDGAYAGCTGLTAFSIEGNPQLGEGIFRDCTSLEKGVFKGTLTSIPASTFEDCRLLDFTIPEGTKEIGARAFKGTAIKAADLRTTDSVGEYAFANCLSLKSVQTDISNHITFGKGVFFGDPVLETLDLTETNAPALLCAHNSASVTTVTAPVIEEAAFANNKTLSSVTFGQSLAEVRANAFRNCTSLKVIDAADVPEGNVPEADATSFSGLENEEGRYPIDLLVNGSSKSWEEHPVWRLFNIRTITGVDNIAGDASADIRVERNGSSVTASANLPIELFEIYSTSGTLLVGARPGTDSYTASGMDSEEVLLVRVKAGATVKIVKII